MAANSFKVCYPISYLDGGGVISEVDRVEVQQLIKITNEEE